MVTRVLVADDDPAILDAIQLMLSLEGYQVDTTVDGETLYKMEKDFPDVLLLDIWMSGQDGRELCKYLKKNPHTKSIPIIMISASRDVELSAKEAGAEDFLAKPFDMDELYEKVRKHTKSL